MASRETLVPGIINQMYEDRKSGRKGKLLNREEKYRTLLMESPDGGAFNITYASFKSNWRKVADEATEEVVEESVSEVVEEPVIETENVEEEPVAEEPKVKKQRAKKGNSNVYKELVDKVVGLTKSDRVAGSLDTILIPYHSGIAIKRDGRRIFEFYAHTREGKIRICMKMDTFDKVDWNKVLPIQKSDVSFMENFIMTTFFKFDFGKLDEVLELVEGVFVQSETENK